MSKTDNTQPIRLLEVDPTVERFKKVGSMYWPTDGTSEHFWRKIGTCNHWPCSNKKVNKTPKRSARVLWKNARQKSLAYVRSGDYDVDIAPEKYRYH